MPRKRTQSAASTVWVSWQAAESSKITEGELQSLNDDGYAVLRISGAQTLWIPLQRIYSISTKLTDIAEAALLQDQSAAQAAAVIEAVASEE